MGFLCFLCAWCCGYPRTVLSLEQGLMILLLLILLAHRAYSRHWCICLFALLIVLLCFCIFVQSHCCTAGCGCPVVDDALTSIKSPADWANDARAGGSIMIPCVIWATEYVWAWYTSHCRGQRSVTSRKTRESTCAMDRSFNDHFQATAPPVRSVAWLTNFTATIMSEFTMNLLYTGGCIVPSGFGAMTLGRIVFVPLSRTECCN